MAAPAPLGSVDDPSDAALTLADPLGALVLALMSRLLASRAVGAVAEGDGLRVEVVKGKRDRAGLGTPVELVALPRPTVELSTSGSKGGLTVRAGSREAKKHACERRRCEWRCEWRRGAWRR